MAFMEAQLVLSTNGMRDFVEWEIARWAFILDRKVDPVASETKDG